MCDYILRQLFICLVLLQTSCGNAGEAHGGKAIDALSCRFGITINSAVSESHCYQLCSNYVLERYMVVFNQKMPCKTLIKELGLYPCKELRVGITRHTSDWWWLNLKDKSSIEIEEWQKKYENGELKIYSNVPSLDKVNNEDPYVLLWWFTKSNACYIEYSED